MYNVIDLIFKEIYIRVILFNSLQLKYGIFLYEKIVEMALQLDTTTFVFISCEVSTINISIYSK